MKCVICESDGVSPGATTVVLERGGNTVIFRGVPAEVCSDCGEAYVSDDIASVLFKRVEQAASKGTELEIIRFAA
jgi:YgiT-type zinc finger domain-containing protein